MQVLRPTGERLLVSALSVRAVRGEFEIALTQKETAHDNVGTVAGKKFEPSKQDFTFVCLKPLLGLVNKKKQHRYGGVKLGSSHLQGWRFIYYATRAGGSPYARH